MGQRVANFMACSNIVLCEEQTKVKDFVSRGFSVFLTGKARVGKSFLLRLIVEEQHEKGDCCVTASTGIAAVDIGGNTIHSFAGIGTGSKSAHKLFAAVSANDEARERWARCRILVIDEISMVSAELFDKLEFFARCVRWSCQPFSGIHLLLCGDFFQLKPVKSHIKPLPQEFCFKSEKWPICIDVSVELQTVHRQNEPELISLLNEVRQGQCLSLNSLIKIQHLSHSLKAPELDVVHLFATNDEVNECNDHCLQLLPGEPFVFYSVDSTHGQKMLKECPVHKTLALKVNCRVVLLKNFNSLLVSGLRGTVERFVGGIT